MALYWAFRGIWIEKTLEDGHVREYWDEGDIDETDTLTLDASSAESGPGASSATSLTHTLLSAKPNTTLTRTTDPAGQHPAPMRVSDSDSLLRLRHRRG